MRTDRSLTVCRSLLIGGGGEVGLDLIPLNFPLGCGPGPDPPQFPPWVWAWRRRGSIMAFCCGLLLCHSVMAFWFGGLLIEGSLLVESGLLIESGLLLWPSGKAFWWGGLLL